jgi:gamma-glutamylcyclotransferase (GGCT)/AIG2-like uncharacterized protein YtfP
MVSAQRHRLFVYGTLRRGGAQAGRMVGAEWIGSGRVRADLFRVSWYPGLVLRETGSWVTGDVYAVDDELLEKLDQYEGDEYRRVRVVVEGDAAGEAWIWEWAGEVPSGGGIVSGDWLAAE